MTRDEVRDKMHDYMDDLLSVEERDTIDSYLEEYQDIAQEYELLEKLLEKTESLPIGIKPPKELIQKVTDELLSFSIEESEEKKKQEEIRKFTVGRKEAEEKAKKNKEYTEKKQKVSKPKRKFPKGPIILFFILVIAAGGYFAYDLLIDNFPWRLKPVYGQYTVNGTFSAENNLNVEDNLATFDSSKVSINVPNAGRVELNSFTTIKILQGKDSENIVSLESGKLDVYCKINDPRLTITTPAVELNSLGGEYSVEIDKNGSVLTETYDGLVKLATGEEELLLIQDHKCTVLADGEIGFPIHYEASDEFEELITQASFNKNEVINYNLILEKATPSDGITLFYLMTEAESKPNRILVFSKLNELYPMPPGLTQEGIINLNQDMLKTWREDIDWQI